MNNYLTLMKTLFRQKLRFDKYNSAGKKNRYGLVFLIVGICCLPLFAMIAISVYSTGAMMKLNGLLTEGYTYLITAMQAIVMFTGIVGMLNVIYFSRDTEFLLSLPIKPTTVYAAKLTYVYVDELITGIISSLLFLVPYAIGSGAAFYTYLQIILVILIAPMLPLLLGALIAIPLMYIIGFFKNKGIVTSIVYVLFMGIAFGLYYYFIYKFTSNISDDAEIGEMLSQLLVSLAAGARYILPNFLLATTLNPLTFGEYILSFVLAIGINGLLLLLAVLISSLVYRSTVSKQLENPKTKVVIKSEEKRKGVVNSLIKNDLRRLLRDSSMGTLTLFQLVIVPVMAVFVIYQFTSNGLGGDPTVTSILPIGATAFMLFMILSTNTAATSAITRENRSFYIYKTLPIKYEKILTSKIIIGVLFNQITIIITSVITTVLTQTPWYYGVGIFLTMSSFNLGTVCLQVLIDLALPRLNWTTFNEGAKNNPSSMFSMLIGFIAFIIVGGIGVAFLFPVFTGETLAPYTMPLMWTTLTAIGIIYSAICASIVKKKGESFFNRIEQ